MSRVLVESGPDQGTLWHSGAFSQEQRDLYAGQAWADLGHRPVILITGQDRLTWIHNLTTQHVLDLAPKLWVENLILSPHGHVEHAFMMMDDGEITWIHCEPHTGNDLVQ